MDNTLIIGIGNEYRRDDGVGLRVARELRGRLPAITILELSGEGAALMDAWRDAGKVLLIDAVQTGAAAGTIFRLDAKARHIPSEFFHYSTHAFGVAEAIGLARTLKQLPPRVLVYGIEGADFAAGTGLSPKVEASAARVTEQIAREAQH
jgi:hydrogenase maturation protease